MPRTRTRNPDGTTSSTKSIGVNPAFHLTGAQDKALGILSGMARHILLYGGSRSGKTFFFVLCMLVRAARAPGSRHLILRRHFNAVKRSIWYDTLPSVLRTCFPGMLYQSNKADWYMRFYNDSEIWIGGLDIKERVEKILGQEYATIFFNECSEMDYSSVTTASTRLAQKINGLRNKLFYDCNPPSTSHWVHSLFVKKENPLTRQPLANADQYTLERMNPIDNRENIAEGYIEDVLANLPERQRRRFLLGEFLEDLEGALWTRDMIAKARTGMIGRQLIKRIVVAIDPAVTSGMNAAETGIVVAGEHSNGKDFLVLDDVSLRGTPLEWATEAADAFRRWEADRVIGEVNNGGELVEANIRTVDPNIPYTAVRATRGKIKRAEPVAGLYEQGRVKHCGTFPELEDQMCAYTGEQGEKSPDRMDAGVWGLTYLSGKPSGNVGVW